MRELITILDEAATSLGLFFFNGRPSFQNLQACKEDNHYPVCFLTEPLISHFDFRESGGSSLTATWPIELHFLKLSDLEYTQQQHDPIIAEMRSLALDYVKVLYNLEIPNDGRLEFEAITDIEIENVINMFAANTSGVRMNLTLQPLMPESVC